MKRLAVLLLLGVCGTPSRSLGQGGDTLPTPPATLHPGDRLNISVLRNQELSGTFTVDPDGTLHHPLYSAVQVAGVPIPEVRSRVDVFLRRFEAAPKFTVEPQYRVYVGGQVRDQNQQYLPEISIGQAITQAGGSTAPNRRYRVRVIRDGRTTTVNMNAPAAAVVLQAPVRSGDQVLVEERPTFNRTYLQPGLQVLQVVTSLLSTYVFIDTIVNRSKSGS